MSHYFTFIFSSLLVFLALKKMKFLPKTFINPKWGGLLYTTSIKNMISGFRLSHVGLLVIFFSLSMPLNVWGWGDLPEGYSDRLGNFNDPWAGTKEQSGSQYGEAGVGNDGNGFNGTKENSIGVDPGTSGFNGPSNNGWGGADDDDNGRGWGDLPEGYSDRLGKFPDPWAGTKEQGGSQYGEAGVGNDGNGFNGTKENSIGVDPGTGQDNSCTRCLSASSFQEAAKQQAFHETMAILRGKQNASFGYQGIGSEPVTAVRSGNYQTEWHRDFFIGVHSYQLEHNVPEYQRLPEGPAEAAINKTNATPEKIAECRAIDSAFRAGLVDVSTPENPFDGAITENLTPAERMTLEYSVVVTGTMSDLATLAGDGDFLGETRNPGQRDVPGGTIYVPTDIDALDGFEETQRVLLTTSLYEAMPFVVHKKALSWATTYTEARIYKKEMAELGLSPRLMLYEADKTLVEEAFDLAEAMVAGASIMDFQGFEKSGQFVTNDTRDRIAEISPDFEDTSSHYQTLAGAFAISRSHLPIETVVETLKVEAGLTQDEGEISESCGLRKET